MGQSDIIRVMKEGRWYTIKDLVKLTGKSESSIGANLRAMLRHNEVEVRRKWLARRTLEYRLTLVRKG